MTFTLNATVAALIPEAIVARVQNAVDTEFSNAMDEGMMEEAAKWKGSVKAGTKERAESIKVNRTLKTKWQLTGNPPGRLILLSIHLANLEADCGEIGVASLPDFAVTWFAKLEARRVKEEAEAKAAAAAAKPAVASK